MKNFCRILFAAWAVACFQIALGEETSTTLSQDFTEKVNTFGLDVYKELAKTKGNVFFSPISISLALGMTSLGAKGATLQEILTAMGTSEDDIHSGLKETKEILSSAPEEIILAVANKLYGEQSYDFLDDFKEKISEYYGSTLEELDFKNQAEESRKAINKWVSDTTKDKIQELLSSFDIDSITKIVIVNAIYFKGEWKTKFDKDATVDEDFHLSDEKVIKVPTMKGKINGSVGYSRELKSDVLELPYKGDRLSMFVISPIEGESTIEEVESLLSGSALSSLALKSKDFDIWLPKFKMESTFNLEHTLKELGVRSMFGDEADLSGMDGSESLFVSAMVHKAFIEVNEEGAEAAAATGVAIKLRSASLSFKIDHPFIFLIQDKQTKTVLFLGKYTGLEPGLESQ